ncbi:MAG: hypothetical protein ABR616_09995 [Dermatophilaceae bacterium]
MNITATAARKLLDDAYNALIRVEGAEAVELRGKILDAESVINGEISGVDSDAIVFAGIAAAHSIVG